MEQQRADAARRGQRCPDDRGAQLSWLRCLLRQGQMADAWQLWRDRRLQLPVNDFLALCSHDSGALIEVLNESQAESRESLGELVRALMRRASDHHESSQDLLYRLLRESRGELRAELEQQFADQDWPLEALAMGDEFAQLARQSPVLVFTSLMTLLSASFDRDGPARVVFRGLVENLKNPARVFSFLNHASREA